MSVGHLGFNGPMDEQKCPVDDIEMSIGHLAEVLDMYGL